MAYKRIFLCYSFKMFLKQACCVALLVLLNFIAFNDAQDVESRIAGGGFSGTGQYPFLASIRRFGVHYCGGSIVNRRYVLTAAHCIFNQTQFTIEVVVGSSLLNSGGVHHKVKSLILHELYRYEVDIIADNDIGLILLEDPITLGPFAKTVKLPSKAVQVSTGAGGTSTAVLIGWGRESQPAPAPSNTLKQLNVKLISNLLCGAISTRRTVVYSNFCSLSPRGEGGCYGDSGTPLIDPQTNEQIGIYSWVVPPCGTGLPDGYTKVWEYLDWINLHVSPYPQFLDI